VHPTRVPRTRVSSQARRSPTIASARPIRIALPACLAAAFLASAPTTGAAAGVAAPESLAIARHWPEGSRIAPFEDLEGVILVEGMLRGPAGRDTVGPLVLDTGAGFLALDRELAIGLGLADSAGPAGGVEFAPRPLARLAFAGCDIDQVSPVLTMDGDIVRRVTDRPVLGLIGREPLGARAISIDYREELIGLIPVGDGRGPGTREAAPGERGARDAAADAEAAIEASRAALRGVIAAGAHAVPFRLAGDGKIMVAARVSDPRPPRFGRTLTLIVDTGATKCVLFGAALEERVPRAAEWPRLRGLSAPTLLGAAHASIARVPALELPGAGGAVRTRDLDVAVIDGPLGENLSRGTGEPVHGLLGYSFLRRYRVTIDYPHRVLWLEPEARPKDRPFEYSHVGVQVERVEGVARIVAVADHSPAARMGIAAGDEIVAIDGTPAASLDILELARRLEGAPGTAVTLIVRRGTSERACRLTRRRLL
jgi:hypothetical protein